MCFLRGTNWIFRSFRRNSVFTELRAGITRQYSKGLRTELQGSDFRCGKRFFITHSVKTGSATHPGSCTMGTEDPFPKVKRPEREPDHSPLSSAECKAGGKQGGSACHLVSCSSYSTLKMEAICTSKTSVNFQRTTRRYIPEDSTLQIHLCLPCLALPCLALPWYDLFMCFVSWGVRA
jgi:hypothetical protein